MLWKVCPRFSAYEVNEVGDVRRVRPARGGRIGKLMKPHVREDGYAMYILREGERSFHVKAHQLVAEAFLGPKPFPDAEVCHRDGSRHNDHHENLRWGTRKSNHADKVEHGTAPRGENHGGHKIKSADIVVIKRKIAEGALQREVAAEYGVQQSQISRIMSGARRAYG